MAARREFVFVGVFFFIVFCTLSWKHSMLGVKDAVKFAGRALLILGVLTWMSSSLYPKLKSYLFPPSPTTLQAPVEDAQNTLKQQEARREQQLQHNVTSDAYNEAVLKPRQEAVVRKKEEDFYRMTGQLWKLSQGFQLGGDKEMEANGEVATEDTPNQRAAKKRKELERPRQTAVLSEHSKDKKIIILPDEPPDIANGVSEFILQKLALLSDVNIKVVKIALRCPSGRIIRRNFFKDCSSTVLLDWLHKSGYYPTLYALYTSYPRQPLLTHKDLSMEDVGIVTHTTLNVEEKDPSTT